MNETKMTTITVEIPEHLREWFLGITSRCVEQTYMECYLGSGDFSGSCINFSYPGWNDTIVITEHQYEQD